MEKEEMSKYNLINPVRFSLKLKDGASRHLFVHKIKELIKNNKTLHPQMEKTLKMLKKAHKPYIELAPLKEIVIDGREYCHYERSVAILDENKKVKEGMHTGWLKTYWSREEREDFDKDPKEHVRKVLEGIESLGYEFYNSRVINLEDPKGREYIEYLESQTQNSKPLKD